MASRSANSWRAERAALVLLAALLACSLAALAAEPIPFKRDADPLDAGLLLRLALALGLVIALAVGAVYALKRFLPGTLGGVAGAPGRINVLETRRVTPRLTLFLVEIDGRRIVLAQSGEQVRSLALDPPAGRDAPR